MLQYKLYYLQLIYYLILLSIDLLYIVVTIETTRLSISSLKCTFNLMNSCRTKTNVMSSHLLQCKKYNYTTMPHSIELTIIIAPTVELLPK